MNQEDFYICSECGGVVLRTYATRHVDFHARVESVREAMRLVCKVTPIPPTNVKVEIDMEPVDWKDRPAR